MELLFSLMCLAQWRGGAVHEPGNSAETFPISPLVNYTPTLADRRNQQGRRSCGIYSISTDPRTSCAPAACFVAFWNATTPRGADPTLPTNLPAVTSSTVHARHAPRDVLQQCIVGWLQKKTTRQAVPSSRLAEGVVFLRYLKPTCPGLPDTLPAPSLPLYMISCAKSVRRHGFSRFLQLGLFMRTWTRRFMDMPHSSTRSRAFTVLFSCDVLDVHI